MQIDDLKITAHKPCVSAQTGPAGQVLKAVNGEARTPAVVPDALDITDLLADVVTISTVTAPVPEPGLCKETAVRAQQPVTPRDVETKDFTGTAPKEKLVKDERCRQNTVITGALDYLEPERGGDVVTISRGLNSLLKSALFHGAGSARQIDLPQGVGISPFLVTLLSEVLPGWKGRLLKVYRRKSRAVLRENPDSDGREEEGRGEPTGHESDCDDGGPLRRNYRPEPIKLTSTGTINTGDKRGLRFRLDLEIVCEGTVPCAHGVMPGPLVINYAGLSGELEDARFAFEVDAGKDSARFTGPGLGRLIIDLVEVGAAKDGSVIYGVPGDYPWIEEKTDPGAHSGRG